MSSASVTHDFANGTIGDADQVDQNFADLVNFANTHLVHNHDPAITRRGVRLHKTASLVATGSSTPIGWSDEREDTDGFWSAGTTVTIPAGMAGVYVITFVTQGPITAGRAFLEIALTSTLTDIPPRFRSYMEAAEDIDTATGVVPLAVGDSFVTNVFHSTGSSVTFESWLSCYRISA